ncbi:MAG: tRNA (adenosine(37)-N6)-threonylcarbamoyltransferase complex transferase subunit TsaD [Candidatus Peribacteraceae bacterium]|jgi:N6-L-threonylcarbamoyladenine synthase|nr:tRNA (adenosine(37)-N6)-threonylcarbamoyltransferase complex transferase subunit TsaD [Candidatus Peribacteraceae bacterium]MDP7476907.1 tRNA (adenosine(37)-N6)-threonylcarbamoyltransferase complex transferase subunit TsaD [Candidatus Peribacteraceae bacterium]
MRILGIETSCDETAAAVVENGIKVESNAIATTKEIFSDLGGVVPEDAARRQVECILPVVHTALKEAGVSMDDIDMIAVTKGPGLLGSLLVGISAARTIASIHNKPLIGVHHTLGHLSSIWLDATTEPQFPCITLSASGGHTDLWLRTSHTEGELLGKTRDDAAGEAFDKGAAMLGLPYPGGPSISDASQDGNELKYKLPIALKGEDTLDFSFSGLKTALKYTIRDVEDAQVPDLAASYQLAICTQLCDRIVRAVKNHKAKEVHLVGGVSANIRLRSLVEQELGDVSLRVPKKISYCTDNAAMIAAAGHALYETYGSDAAKDFVSSATLRLEECD